MNFEKIKETFEYSAQKDSKEKKPMIEWITYLTLFFLVVYGYKAYTQELIYYSLLHYVLFFLTGFIFILYKKLDNASLIVSYINIVLTAFVGFIIMTGGTGRDTGLIWFQVLPLLTFSINGLGMGVLMSVFYIFLGLFATVFTHLPFIIHDYPQHVVYSFYGTFTFIVVSSFVREFSLVRSHMKENAYKEKLERLSQRDELTNTYNRRSTNEKINDLYANNIGFALVFVDIDNFKTINDNYGHECGDVVIQKIADIFANGLRDCDYLSRWGGEEFLIVLPNNSIETARSVSERLRKAVESTQIEHNGFRFNITASFGVEHSDNATGKDNVILKADDKLYQAKSNGRNKVVC